MFKVGDKVRWASQAQGVWKEKIGTVEEIIPASASLSPSRVRDQYGVRYTLDNIGWGMSRPGVSYLVSVKAEGKGKPKMYWPRTSQLSQD